MQPVDERQPGQRVVPFEHEKGEGAGEEQGRAGHQGEARGERDGPAAQPVRQEQAGGRRQPAEQDQQGDRVQDERVGLERHEVRAVQGETGVAERGNRGEQPLPQGPRQGGAGRQEAAGEQHRAGQLNQQGETDDERQRGEQILVAGLGEGGEQPLLAQCEPLAQGVQADRGDGHDAEAAALDE